MNKFSLLTVLAMAEAYKLESSNHNHNLNHYRPPAGSVPWVKEVKANTWVDPDWDINYFVPDFGIDHQIEASLENMENAEKKLKHTMQASFKKPKGPP